MCNKDNIMEIIKDHQKEIDSLENNLRHIDSESAQNAIQNRLSFLYDNQYRYMMQARAWGLIEGI